MVDVDAVKVGAEVLGDELGWDGERRREEIEAYERLVVERYQAPLAPTSVGALAEAG